MARDSPSSSSSCHGPASFSTQANALLRKNLTFQKQNIRSNVRLVTFPILLCVLLAIMQSLIFCQLDNGSNTCGCTCIDSDADGKCEEECGVEHSTVDQVRSCPIPSPPKLRPLLQIPAPAYRAVQTDFISHADLPSKSCKKTGSCPAAILLTGSNLTLGQSMFLSSSTLNASDMLDSMANNVLGSDSEPPNSKFLSPELPLYNPQPQCASNFKFSASFPMDSAPSDTNLISTIHTRLPFPASMFVKS